MAVKTRLLLPLILVLIGAAAAFTAFAGASADGPPAAYSLIQSGSRPMADTSGLLSAWESRSNGVVAQTVFPPDSRIPINDTTDAPWRDVVSLFIQQGSAYYSCTGSMLGPNVVLTAAHCLFDGGTYVDAVLVAPGATPTTNPYGYIVSNDLAVPKGWAQGVGQYPEGSAVPLSPYDFGLVILHGSPFGNALSPYFTIANVSDAYLERPSTLLATAGYPGDKTFDSMWFTSTPNFIFDSTYICTDLDIYQGQSGSPIIAWDPTGTQFPYVFSVVSVGNNTCNYSVRFTASVLAALNQWCADDACTVQSVYLDQAVSTASPSPTSTSTPTPTSTSTPTPTPTSTRSPSPSPTATGTPTIPAGTHSANIAGGVNLVAGPLSGPVSAATFASCLPDGSWTALYTWDRVNQHWLHYFAPPVPGYVNQTDGITSIAQGEGVAVLVPPGAPNRSVRFPDSSAAKC